MEAKTINAIAQKVAASRIGEDYAKDLKFCASRLGENRWASFAPFLNDTTKVLNIVWDNRVPSSVVAFIENTIFGTTHYIGFYTLEGKEDLFVKIRDRKILKNLS